MKTHVLLKRLIGLNNKGSVSDVLQLQFHIMAS